MDSVLVDSIVKACIKLFTSLPKTGKPTSNEWTVISSVVGVFDDDNIKVLSLGTGSKCIGQSSMNPNGNVINDSHAEVIARRAFLKYLYHELIELNENNSSEIFFRKSDENFNVFIKNSVKFYFVTSMLPCGDASIMPKTEFSDNKEFCGEHVKNSEQMCMKNILKRSYSDENLKDIKKVKVYEANNETIEEDIHRTGAKCLSTSLIQDPHLPGVLYHNIGAVRTKPGRGDPTLSVSCSDKIARWNAVGWQGAILSLFLKAALKIDGIICGGGTPFSEESFNRAVNRRIGKDKFIPIYLSNVPFPNIKDEKKSPNPSSIIWCIKNGNKTEVSINGYKQGITKKYFKDKSARTSICKKELFILFEKVVNSLPLNNNFCQIVLGLSDASSLKNITYRELKLKAIDHQTQWEFFKNNYFKVWSNKPISLCQFTLCND